MMELRSRISRLEKKLETRGPSDEEKGEEQKRDVVDRLRATALKPLQEAMRRAGVVPLTFPDRMTREERLSAIIQRDQEK